MSSHGEYKIEGGYILTNLGPPLYVSYIPNNLRVEQLPDYLKRYLSGRLANAAAMLIRDAAGRAIAKEEMEMRRAEAYNENGQLKGGVNFNLGALTTGSLGLGAFGSYGRSYTDGVYRGSF